MECSEVQPWFCSIQLQSTLFFKKAKVEIKCTKKMYIIVSAVQTSIVLNGNSTDRSPEKLLAELGVKFKHVSVFAAIHLFLEVFWGGNIYGQLSVVSLKAIIVRYRSFCAWAGKCGQTLLPDWEEHSPLSIQDCAEVNLGSFTWIYLENQNGLLAYYFEKRSNDVSM